MWLLSPSSSQLQGRPFSEYLCPQATVHTLTSEQEVSGDIGQREQFNPNAPSNHSSAACYHCHEQAKRNLYETRFHEVERALFAPLVFTTSGGASLLTSTFLKHLASKLAEKRDVAYSTTIGWLRVRLSFSLRKSAVMCMWARHDSMPDVAVVESQLQLD